MAFADPVPELEPENARDKITFRSVVFGVATILLTTWYYTYYAGNLVKSYFPVAILIPFVSWVFLNALLKSILPRIALSRTELIVILSMTWIMGNLPAVGWALHSVSLIPSPEFYASPENRLQDTAIPFLPKWLFLDAGIPIVREVYTGLRQGESIPWLLWAQPFCCWLIGILAAVMAGFFGSVLFFKQWHEKERLVFPLAEFPTALLEETPGERLPAVFKDRVFWTGFALVAGIIGWNILGYFAISLPRITLFDVVDSKAVPLARYFPPIYLRVQPLIIGLAYLGPLDILLSFWVYDLIDILKIGLMNRTGFSVGLEGQVATGGEISMLLSHGALTFLVVWSVWVARRHLKDTLLKALSPAREHDDGAPITYRTAWLGLVFSAAIMCGWLMSLGISFPTAVAQMLLMFICYFGISKYAATTGFTFLNPAAGKGFDIVLSLAGTAHLRPASIAMATLINRNMFLGEGMRTTALPAMPHILRMLNGRLKRYAMIALLIPLAYVLGYFASVGIKVYRCYTEGGLNGQLVDWPINYVIQNIPYIEGSKVTVFDPGKLTVWLVGVAISGGLVYLRSRFSWWFFHPVAIAFPNNRYAFCVFLAWMVKFVVLRFGGASLYRRSLPFWYGAIVGYLFGIGISSIIDAIWFPGGGHFVHGW